MQVCLAKQSIKTKDNKRYNSFSRNKIKSHIFLSHIQYRYSCECSTRFMQAKNHQEKIVQQSFEYGLFEIPHLRECTVKV